MLRPTSTHAFIAAANVLSWNSRKSPQGAKFLALYRSFRNGNSRSRISCVTISAACPPAGAWIGSDRSLKALKLVPHTAFNWAMSLLYRACSQGMNWLIDAGPRSKSNGEPKVQLPYSSAMFHCSGPYV